MPKKAVAVFFALAFLGAAFFVYFTFPRTKDEIPKSNNQRPFPSAPDPNAPNQPGGVSLPETVPQPNMPKVPPGPTLRVMAWASAADARRLDAEADAFAAATGRQVSLTLNTDLPSYRHDLQQALAAGTPPDVSFVSCRDFCGLDPAKDLAAAKPIANTAPRSITAFTVNGEIKAVPVEFSVEVLYYNPSHFDQAGIAYPGPHWTWDILEADARALGSQHIKDPAGQPAYPLEMPADFDLWNILCTQAGQPVLDLDAWHLGDNGTKEAQMRGLELIRELFQAYTITAPSPKSGAPQNAFAQQRASLLIAPSDLAVSLPPTFHHAFTVLPHDLGRASLARVNGWAVTSRSTQADAALVLAQYLARQPVHAGWSSVLKPSDDTSPAAICHEALSTALVPRLNPKSARLVQFLDQQIALLAHNSQQTTDATYAKIQTAYQSDPSSPAIRGGLPTAAGQPAPKVDAPSQIRGL